MFGRILLGLCLCLSAAGGEGAGAGGAPPGQGSPPPPAPPPPAPDPEKVKAEARAAVLKDLGFDGEEAYKKHLDEKKKAEEAKLSEQERAQKALTEALGNHKAAEAKLDAIKAELKAEREERAIEKLFYAQGVRPEAQTVARALYDEKKKADPKGDDKTIFEKMREEWPNVFGTAAPPPANTSPAGTPPASPFGNGPTGPTGGTFDALKATPEQVTQFRNNGYRA